MKTKPEPSWEEEFNRNFENVRWDSRVGTMSITDFIRSLLATEKKALQKEIFGKFMMAGSALTMYNQDDEGLMFAADELRKDMIRICEMDKLKEIEKGGDGK